ncbi:MAG TPA: GIY-YIG nuclease family protein [Candidatus Babeliales bacterium]|jgi:excinuclease ABC subunit C|nr:GIY-YIG nuclease family protein [Candidatus Babeliales bacterium]
MYTEIMKYICPLLPKLPGIYMFKGSDMSVLYVGKAANLQERVRSYFSAYSKDWRIKSLLDEHQTIDHIVTHTDHEALVLEAHMIQQYKPKYNKMLKEGQPFIYIMCTQDVLPVLKIVRNKQKKGIYFGPFMHRQQARKTVYFLSNTFKLNVCNKKIANGCLQYHIGICAGSCRPDFDVDHYRIRIELALHALKDERKEFCSYIQDQIKQCINNLQFERAQHLHAYLQDTDAIFDTMKHHRSYMQQAQSVAHVQSKHQSTDYLQTAQDLQTLLGFDHPIRTIDCFDISHFQSRSIVGSCIRFTDGKPDKNNFRRFAIRSINKQNDYAALQEIVQRRYKDPTNIPDLILIDGGIGQLNAIRTLFPDAPLAALAKREETVFCAAHPGGIKLDPHQPAAKTILALRDYAHHFAITYHRLKQHTM